MEVSSEDINISRIQILAEIFFQKNLRKVAFLMIFYAIFVISFLGVLIFFLYSLKPTLEILWIIIPAGIGLFYLFLVVGIYLNSLFFYTVINPTADLKNAKKVLSRLGKNWFITPFLFLVSFFHSFKSFLKQYGLKILIPITKTRISIAEWSVQASSLLLPIMAMKEMSIYEATDELIKFQIKYFDFFFKRGVEYRFLFPILFVVILFASIFGGGYLSAFILYLFRVPFESELYTLIFITGYAFFPILFIIFLVIFFYGTREIMYAKLYAKEYEKDWQKLKKRWGEKD